MYFLNELITSPQFKGILILLLGIVIGFFCLFFVLLFYQRGRLNEKQFLGLSLLRKYLKENTQKEQLDGTLRSSEYALLDEQVFWTIIMAIATGFMAFSTLLLAMATWLKN